MNSATIKTAKQFSLVGPLFGGALYFIPMVFLDRTWIHPPANQTSLGISLSLCVMLSYIFGLIPAALTGAALGVIRHKKGQFAWSTSAALIGLFAGGMVGGGIDLYNAARSDSFLPISAAFLAVPSSISALVCSCIFKPINSWPQTERPGG